MINSGPDTIGVFSNEHNIVKPLRVWSYRIVVDNTNIVIGFDGPVAGHAEWWFLSVFGCPENSFNEGGLRTSEHSYGAGQWNFFHANAPPVNVRQYIINQDPSPVPGLQNQVVHFQNQVVNLQNANELLTNYNAYLAAALLNAMPQIPNLDGFLPVYGPGLEVSSEAIRNWNEARKNGGGGIGGGIGGGGIGGIGGIGGVDDGKKGDGKRGSGGADGAHDGWLKSGCICPETPPCPVVIPCPEPVVCNIAKIQIQLNSTIKSLDECKKQKDQTNDNLNVCKSHKDETQDWLTDCQKEYVKQTSHSSKDDTLISLRNCQAEYQKETFKKDKLCRGLSKHIIGYLDFCEDKVEKLKLANCE
ncbi:hypothetical protein DDB_G0275481 [Dictyostelium discoideum AX4]|uniref:Uncharacterized protein n=1 Tax=Dictyostelium discoideum TaxID=44689 RepID=Q86ID7_DICDI|nr:hypothetical protein DDB_G0275481 [Dictyostelium discoideum AX4]EAL69491.1 hypothetical protein DDB_G0275481 [Dictyostelium discoideum AX4]|eukprot:XP_643583.1 hypothetical protein DDB_G0275481 [Dictyostelium discoideum AX4]